MHQFRHLSIPIAEKDEHLHSQYKQSRVLSLVNPILLVIDSRWDVKQFGLFIVTFFIYCILSSFSACRVHTQYIHPHEAIPTYTVDYEDIRVTISRLFFSAFW